MSDASLLWGAYRSSLYFGVRPRIPRSLLSGLMWYNADSVNGIQKIRHVYEQGDNMKKANWIYYDPRFGGRQVIDDSDLHVKIIIDFVKSDDGKSWAVKVRSKPHKGHSRQNITFLWYSGLEGETSPSFFNEGERSNLIKLDNQKDATGYDGDVRFMGISEELGAFQLVVTKGPDTNKHPTVEELVHPEVDPRRTHHVSLSVPDDNVWRAGDIFGTLLQESVQDLIKSRKDAPRFPPNQLLTLRDMHQYEGNLHFVQKTFTGPAEFHILFNNAETPVSEKFSPQHLDARIKETKSRFDAKFARHFPITAASETEKQFGMEVLSGLLGGLSYFYGDHLVDRNTVLNEETFEKLKLEGSPEGPHELFTLVPSRPFFPRGFLWDEGFHLLPLLKYDSDLCLEVIQSWFSLIDEDGWIAREQILGPEARSKVPAEFQVQSPEIVNPPTLMLVLSQLLQSVSNRSESEVPVQLDDASLIVNQSELGLLILGNSDLLIDYAKKIYPKLKTHYQWFRRTQQGLVEEFERGDNSELYRWRGRTISHSLASGIDDYPRALPVDVAELNVDLLSWIGVMTRSMKLIAEIVHEPQDLAEYTAIEANIVENLDRVHWSLKHNTFCDVSVDDNDENIHVCHKGYISLFPFLTKLIPNTDEAKIVAMVDLIANPAHLRSKYGIRLLSKQDMNYRKGENYWRSPIWININYLVLESLQHYHEHAQLLTANRHKLASVYEKLRKDLIANIFDQWKSTGYLWEQYDDQTGAGKGAKNFLGWTSLVLLMMNMPESLEKSV